MSCAVCGKPAGKTPLGRNRKYCADACEHDAKNRRQQTRRLRRKHEKATGKFTRCVYCAKHLPEPDMRYCDDRCQRLAQRGTRTWTTGDLSPTKIERIFQAAKARARHQRRMAS